MKPRHRSFCAHLFIRYKFACRYRRSGCPHKPARRSVILLQGGGSDNDQHNHVKDAPRSTFRPMCACRGLLRQFSLYLPFVFAAHSWKRQTDSICTVHTIITFATISVLHTNMEPLPGLSYRMNRRNCGATAYDADRHQHRCWCWRFPSGTMNFRMKKHREDNLYTERRRRGSGNSFRFFIYVHSCVV